MGFPEMSVRVKLTEIPRLSDCFPKQNQNKIKNRRFITKGTKIILAKFPLSSWLFFRALRDRANIFPASEAESLPAATAKLNP
jgi:hypothetical protein